MSEHVTARRVQREDAFLSIQIGQYHRYVNPLERKEHLRVFEGKLSLNELVIITSIDENVHIQNGENAWVFDPDQFSLHFQYEPNGLAERQGQISKLQEENFREQVEYGQLQQALLSFSPHIEPSGKIEGGDLLDAGTDLAVPETGAALAERKLNEFTTLINKTTTSINSRTARISAILAEQSRAMAGKAKQMEEALKLAKEGIWTINLYLGTDERIVQLLSGAPAPAEDKIVISQLVLYMDEECAYAADTGGIDAYDIIKFDKWLKTPAHLQQVLPYQKGIVAIKPRRTDKRYSDDPFVNSKMNEPNRHTYWLIRNGGNLYRVDTAFEVTDHAIPYEDEYFEMFMTDQYNYDLGETEKVHVRPGDPDYMKTMKAADAKKRHYMRILLILQGLIDRAVRTGDNELCRLFHPMPDGVERINIMDERLNEQYVHYNYDAEKKRLFGHGRPSFSDWLEDLNGRLDIGHRVILSTSGLRYQQIDRKDRISPPGAPWPEDLIIHTIERHQGDEAIILYKRKDSVQKGGWGGGYGPAINRASFRIRKDDGFVLNFDLATVEDMEFYLANRLERQNYMGMFPVLKLAIQLKAKEKADEAPFRLLLVGQIKQAYEFTSVEYIESQIDELIEWFKFKNRTHRALIRTDRLAIDMIVTEFGLRRKKDGERARMDHKPVIAAILGINPNAIYIGHKVDNEYVAFVPENDENVFVCEQTYSVGPRKGVVLEEAKHWKTIDKRRLRWLQVYASDRYAKWNLDARGEQFLTDPERELLVQEVLKCVGGNKKDEDDEAGLFFPSGSRKAAAKRAPQYEALIAITLDEDQAVIGWVVEGVAKVPRLLITGKFQKPEYVRAIKLTWERKKGELIISRPDSSSRYSVGAVGHWMKDTDKYHNYTNIKTLWSDADVQRKWDADWRKYENAQTQRQKLVRRIQKVRQATELVIKENVVAHERARYITKFGEEGESLFEAEKGKIEWDRLIPWSRNLEYALDALVERGIDPNGWTVGRCYKEAAAYGFKLDEKYDEPDMKNVTRLRDVDMLPLDFVVEINLSKQLEDDLANAVEED